jgi:hypothetical protein
VVLAAEWPLHELLPSAEIVEGCRAFIDCCFQTHFLPKVRFLAHVERDSSSVNPFSLMCILGMSARFTPSLIQRFGGPEKAADVFVQRAEHMALTAIYTPTLETAQGFMLLGVAEWAKGDCNKSLVSLSRPVNFPTLICSPDSSWSCFYHSRDAPPP